MSLRHWMVVIIGFFAVIVIEAIVTGRRRRSDARARIEELEFEAQNSREAWVALSESFELRAARCSKLEAALREIAKGEGAFSRDQLTHATNCVESMKDIASCALLADTPTGETP